VLAVFLDQLGWWYWKGKRDGVVGEVWTYCGSYKTTRGRSQKFSDQGRAIHVALFSTFME